MQEDRRTYLSPLPASGRLPAQPPGPPQAGLAGGGCPHHAAAPQPGGLLSTNRMPCVALSDLALQIQGISAGVYRAILVFRFCFCGTHRDRSLRLGCVKGRSKIDSYEPLITRSEGLEGYLPTHDLRTPTRRRGGTTGVGIL